ncbi:endonuclease-reverse transcriptase [Gregarina niphandrodes]|uniref:Endonuclease-reverse transcriptase n=1 Tax=Gregarina niphandrodes TaxID=110365 RepID=A0A023AWF5_GRENI|nr:endonuclease-reverse transcriptase [Gregarina niphandrodes]EZG43076.1 endonuclease-reverse transcriptase [Gregarina niphandrodes]|eukprot:XP_011133651.1 endonuclease-reverse transcriptase [Gregarina niphandrodes]
MDRNEAMFKDLVDAYIGMTTTVKELKTEVTDRLNKNIGEIKDKLNTIATKYDMNAQMRSTRNTIAAPRSESGKRGDSKEATTRTGRSTAKQPLNSKTPLPWNRVAGSRTTTIRVGRKNDPVIITENPVTPEDATTPVITLDQQDKKALWEARPPQTVEVTAVTLDRVKPRNLFPAKDWRNLLKKHGIHPVAIWFPWRTSVEILIKTDELAIMNSLAKAMGREALLLDPTKRRDGQPLPLTQAALATSANIRLKDLEYERHWTARKYLEQTIKKLIDQMDDDMTKTMIEKVTTRDDYPTLRTRSRPKHYLVMAVNIDGYNDKKELQLRSLILHNRPHLVIVTETCTVLHRTIYGSQYTVIGNAGPADGVALMIRQDVQYRITTKTTRTITAELDGLVTCVGTYGPTEQTADKVKAQYWDHLTKQIAGDKPMLIAGDLNAGHERTELRTVKGIPNYTRLQRMVQHHDLNILPTSPTWISKRSKDQTPSRTLDRILVSTALTNDNEVQLDWENAPADHAILTYKWIIHSLNHSQGRPRSQQLVRDHMEPITKTWLGLRQKLKLHFRAQQTRVNKQPNPYQRLWEQYRKQNGEEGLTLIDTEGKDMEPEQARLQLRQMLHDRWNQTDSNYIPPRRESKIYMDQPPCTKEIIEAVKAINKKAATGLDGIPARYASAIPIEDLEDFTEQVWRHTKLPRQLVDMKVKPIPKTLPRTTVDNTRPITIPSTVMKIINQIILQHITPYIEPHLLPQQHAYRKGRGTATAVAELFNKFNRQGQTLLLLDLSKAFDTVDHAALFAALRNAQVPSKEYNLIRDQYVDAEVRIQWAKRFTLPFLLTNGIRQGCTLSTTLFNLVEAEREKKCRIKMQRVPYEVIMYADDKAVILEDPTSVQKVLDVNQQTAAEYGMFQNNKKTVQLTLDRGTKMIQTARWMGILLDNKMSMNPEVDHRIDKAKIAAKSYIETIKNIPPSMISTRIKVSGACSIILPHLVYLWREIPFTPQQRATLTDTATQLLARVFDNTSGVTATSILRHVNEITKGLTPRIKEIKTLDHIMPKQMLQDVPMDTGELKGTDIVYARLDQQMEILADKGTAALKMSIPKLQLPTKETEISYYSPREEPQYEETRELFVTTLETSPPTPGFGKDKHHPQMDNMALRLDTIQRVEQVQLTCPYCGATKTTKQAMRSHYTTAHQGLYRPPADDPCFCVACRRVMTKSYYRDHRCRKPKQEEYGEADCIGCGIKLTNPQLSAHLIHCVRYEGQLTPLKQNTGAFEFAKKIREMLRPSSPKLKSTQQLTAETVATTEHILAQARNSLRPHTPRGENAPASKGKLRLRSDGDLNDEVEKMRRDTEERIRKEQSTCNRCNKELKSSQALRRHEALYHPGTERPKGLPVFCIGCNMPFKTAATYVKHKCSGTMAQELSAKRCQMCDQGELPNPEYSAHMLAHQITTDNLEITQKELYDPKKRVTTQVTNKLKVCMHCEMVQTDPHLMKQHYKRYHSGEYKPPKVLPAYCVGCSKLLPIHYYRIHKCRGSMKDEMRTHCCKTCEETMANPELSAHLIQCMKPTDADFDLHKVSKHDYDGIRDLEMRISSEEEEDEESPPVMNIRERTLEAIKRKLMTCPACSKTFTTTQAKRRHDEATHRQQTPIKGNPAWCTGCHRGYQGSSAYTRHFCRNTDHEEDVDACDFCGEKLANPDLSVHRLRHYEEKEQNAGKN